MNVLHPVHFHVKYVLQLVNVLIVMKATTFNKVYNALLIYLVILVTLVLNVLGNIS